MAILLVVAYHVNLLGGGWVGVDVFFVLSGFLITRLLMEGPRLSDFYARRARRLVPALVLLLGGVIVVAAVVHQRLAISTLISAATYTMNFHDYHGVQGPLGPLWSLAQEEQFYLLWPLMLLAVPRWRVQLTVALALLSALQMQMLVSSGADFQRVYFSPDTRAFPLLLGCLLALCEWRPSRRVASVAGVLGAALLGVLLSFGFDRSPGHFQWLLLLGSFGGLGLVIAAQANPWLLRGAALQRLGLYSYGIYLWHYPLILWLPDGLAVALALVAAVLSYHLVELPVRRGRLSAPHIFKLERRRRVAVVAELQPDPRSS